MASLRNLKKDIDMLMSMVLSDCFYVLEHNSKVSEDEVMKIAGEVIRKHRDLRIQANHPDGKDNQKLVKNFYNDLISDMLKSADDSLEKLSAEVKKTI